MSRSFFARDTLAVARELLGQRVVRVFDGRRVGGRIVEVEAYAGEDDQASHASCGPTKRNASMYGPPGYAYVYFVYGMHYCFNAVTDRKGYPAAVLIRALEPLEGLNVMRTLRCPESVKGRRDHCPNTQLTSGPARLCQALGIDQHFDQADLCTPQARLFIEEDAGVPSDVVVTAPRVGVRGDDAALSAQWRFYVRGNQYVSR